MAEPVVSFVVEELGRWLLEEAKLLHGVSEKVEGAKQELIDLRCILKDADAKASKGDNETLSNLVGQIREIAYDLEDVIVTYASRVGHRVNITRGLGIVTVMKRYACIFIEVVPRHKFASELEKQSTKILDMKSKLLNYGVIMSSGGSSSNASSTSQRSATTYCHVPVEHFVGFEQDIEKFVAALSNVEEKTSHRVVSIWGMGGSGKTTLAKKVYNDNRVRLHFDCIAWAYISQQCQKEDVWKEILFQLIPSSSKEERDEINALKDDRLARKLYDVQIERKCLVILDDIWTTEMWDRLSPAFPQGLSTINTTSKMLITTRIKEILPHVDGKGLQHELSCLNEHQSWELFEKIVFSRLDDTNIGDIEKQKMRDLGKKMLKHCGGLPLAVILLGGLASTKHEVDEWEWLESNIKHVMKDTRDLSRMASLSYEELPYYLKPCFLHLANYPEDYEIRVKPLCMIWVAEGIIIRTQAANPNKSSLEMMEEEAYNYFTKLVERSMVQVEKMGSIRGRIKTCRMHDVMRDFCLSKAKELNFVRTINSSSSSTSYHGGHNYKEEVATLNNSSNLSDLSMESKVRRLAIHNLWDSAVSKKLIIHKHRHHLRSLMHFRSSPIYNKILKTLLKGCDLLKVLRFEISDDKFLEEIGKLIHLRYLNIHYSRLTLTIGMETIGNLRCLYALDLRSNEDIFYRSLIIPNGIWMLEQLRHLYLPKRYVVVGIKGDERLKLANLVNFKTIVNIKLQDLTCILIELTNLVKLNIHQEEKTADGGEILQTAISLNNLRSLSWISSWRFPCSPPISNFPNIYKLALMGEIEKPISEIQFPPKLMKITLRDTLFSEDPMPTLGNLPNLRTLNIFWGALWFVKEIVCYKGGFCQLESLSLSHLFCLEQLKVEEGALPRLRRLWIRSCESLKTVSDGFKSIKSLEKIEIVKMSEEFVDRVKEGGEDFDKVKHVPSIIFLK